MSAPTAGASVLIIFHLSLLCTWVDSKALTFSSFQPVIGVPAQATGPDGQKYGQEYVNAHVVKYLEMAGAKVVAIRGGQPKQYYVSLFTEINGILLPGGDVNITSSQFERSSEILYHLAIAANNAGDYFPMWGTCQGFQMLTVLTAGSNFLTRTDSDKLTLRLNLTSAYNSSRLLGSAPSEVIQSLTTEPMTVNAHHWSLLTETYQSVPSLKDFYRVISVNEDRQGKEFVSTFEAYHFPFYGTQWHPEMNSFYWSSDRPVDHSTRAIVASQYFADFFVNEARKSHHRFHSKLLEAKSIIENDKHVFDPLNYSDTYYYNISSGTIVYPQMKVQNV